MTRLTKGRKYIQTKPHFSKGQNHKMSDAAHKCQSKQVPEEILDKYGEVTLAIDIMAINKIPFIVSTSRNIHFGTAEIIHDKTKQTLMTYIQQIVWAYHARGFCICNILADGGFECLGTIWQIWA